MPAHTTHNTPALRFPGYTGVWEQHQLNDYCGQLSATLDPQKTPNSIFAEYSMPAFDNGEIPNIVTGDTMNSTRKILDRSCLLINKLNVRKKRIWLVDKPEDNAVSSAEFIPIYSDEISLKFLKYSVSNESFTTYLEECSSGSSNSQKRITPDVLMSAKLSFPSRREQDAIGQLMTVLDGLINLHQRQTQKLTELKTGLLQNMFPREGESVPRLRFPGFTTTWKQQKVEELMDVTSVKRIHQSDWTTSGVPFLRARDIVARSKHEKITDPLFISQEKYDEYSAISGKVKLGDLLVTGVGTIGIPLLITDDKPIYFKDGNIIWFKNINNTVDGYFLYYAFCQKKVQSFINQAAGKGTVATYTISTAKSTPLVLPSSRNEQQKIGSFFHHFDDLINLHEQYVTTLKHLKKGLLQKMFPQD